MNIRTGADSLAQISASEAEPLSTVARSVGGTEGASASAQKDEANLSAAASHLAQSSEALALLPEVRLEKVASIQSALQAGTYNVPAEDVAKKVVSALLSPEG